MNLYFEITYRCNAKCIFCDIRNINQPDMNIDTYVDFLEQARTLKDQGIISRISIILSGGEPVLHPLIEDFISIGKKYGRVTLVTNGLNPKLILGLDSEPDIYEISFSEFENDDNIYGVKGAFKKKMKLLNELISRRKMVVVRVTATKNSIERIKHYANEYSRFDNVVFFVVPVKHRENRPTIQQLQEINRLRNVFCENKCPAGKGFFCITSNGNVLSCFLARRYLGKTLLEAIENGKMVRPFECENDKEYIEGLMNLKKLRYRK